ncbi:MAG: hypothetical protein AAF902_18775 [Chloroflexota bacterium]
MTAENDVFAGRRRTAWMIVLLAFAVFLVIAISVPLLVSSWLRRSTRPLTTTAVANHGTLALVSPTGETSAILETEGGEFLANGDNLITREADNGSLVITHPDTQALMLRGQIYANTDLMLETADTSRFGVGNTPDEIVLVMKDGRLRLTLPAEEEPIDYRIELPHGTATFSGPGQYSVQVMGDESQISVFDGYVTLESDVGTELEMARGDRGILTIESDPAGPFATSRNLIVNGSFDQGLDFWNAQDWFVELDDQPIGETKIETFTGDASVRFIRPGSGHADASVRQILNQDVTDYELLELVVSMQIHGQTLWVCGQVGSECPLTIRMEYIDEQGIERTWEQGFYADGQISDTAPDKCSTCTPPNNRHIFVQPGRVIIQEIDILQSLALQGFSPPTELKGISITASGHAFDAEVFDIALNARE